MSRRIPPFGDIFDGTEGSGAYIYQRAVGEHSLLGYGPVGSVNRLVRTRMLGGVGRGS